jgi:hypothetical protein
MRVRGGDPLRPLDVLASFSPASGQRLSATATVKLG